MNSDRTVSLWRHLVRSAVAKSRREDFVKNGAGPALWEICSLRTDRLSVCADSGRDPADDF